MLLAEDNEINAMLATTILEEAGYSVEVVGDGAATFRPGDVDDLVRILRELVADPARRTELAHRGSEAVATLSWARTAECTADVYRSVGAPV